MPEKSSRLADRASYIRPRCAGELAALLHGVAEWESGPVLADDPRLFKLAWRLRVPEALPFLVSAMKAGNRLALEAVAAQPHQPPSKSTMPGCALRDYVSIKNY